MKTPCEIVVWYVLPTIRREIAKELVDTYRMKQVDVGHLFGVTDAAISQYLKKKRGGNVWIESSERYPEFLEEIKVSAKRIHENNSWPRSTRVLPATTFLSASGTGTSSLR